MATVPLGFGIGLIASVSDATARPRASSAGDFELEELPCSSAIPASACATKRGVGSGSAAAPNAAATATMKKGSVSAGSTASSRGDPSQACAGPTKADDSGTQMRSLRGIIVKLARSSTASLSSSPVTRCEASGSSHQ